MSLLKSHRHWVFDMDGTLTLAVHDFDLIRSTLELPPRRPILEALAELPADEQAQKRAQLDRIEIDLAAESRAAPGAADLLQDLIGAGSEIGLLTRNNLINAHVTLKAAGLDGHFPTEHMLGRDEAPPKPAPDGILVLLERWGVRPDPGKVVMVGDYLFDLQAGRAANCTTVYVDPTGQYPYAEFADLCVRSLTELRDN